MTPCWFFIGVVPCSSRLDFCSPRLQRVIFMPTPPPRMVLLWFEFSYHICFVIKYIIDHVRGGENICTYRERGSRSHVYTYKYIGGYLINASGVYVCSIGVPFHVPCSWTYIVYVYGIYERDSGWLFQVLKYTKTVQPNAWYKYIPFLSWRFDKFFSRESTI